MKVGVLYPYTESARFLAAKLLDTGFVVTFFCPEKFDGDIASSMITLLTLLGNEQDDLRRQVNLFSLMRSKNLIDCQALGENFDILQLSCIFGRNLVFLRAILYILQLS